MNTKKITTSLLATITLATGLYADGGTLNLSGGGGAITTEYKLLNPNANTGISLDGILYKAAIQNPSSVSDAALEFDFSDTNLTSAVLNGTVIINSDENGTAIDGNSTILSFSQLTSNGIASYKKLNADTGIIDTEKYYEIRADANGTHTGVTYEFNSGVVNKTISLKVFSTSGSPKEVDSAVDTIVEGTTSPQFKFSCIGKYDALINFENFDRTFVPTGHDNNLSTTQDTLVFSIDNKNSGITNSAEGNGTEIIISSDKNLTKLGFNNSHLALKGINVLGHEQNGTGNILSNGYDINFTIINTIPTGISKWYATISDDNASSLSAMNFTMKTVNIEGNSTVQPQIDYQANVDVGEWRNHAFIAQIAGATQNPGVVTSKFFIVNRSCADATPIFKLIQDGKIAVITGDAYTIPVNTQRKITMETLLASAEAQAAGFTTPQFAVEITLPGIAEDFYIYAQSLTSAGYTKDLPVYSTSKRD